MAAALRALIERLPQHSGIVPIIDASVADGRVSIVTPDVTADSLDAALRTFGPAALADALPRLQQLADALDLAARHGLCHGTLSPDSIVVSGDDTRIVGIGVAPTLRAQGILVPVASPYTAPEVLEGDRLTPLADQYSFAIIAYEWLFGRRPDPLVGAWTAPVLPGVDGPRLTSAFVTALASLPGRRFASCTDFVRAIGESSKVSVASVGESRLRAGWVAVALAAGVAVGAAAVWSIAKRGAGEPPSGEAQEYTDAAIDAPEAPRQVSEPALNAPRDEAAATSAAAPPVPRRPASSPPAPARPVPETMRTSDAVKAARVDAGLLLHSTPAGALVTIDGAPRGTTPVAVRGLELGTRSVIVSLPGYRAVARQVELTSERPSRALEIELAPVSRATPAAASEGSLVVDSRPPGAAVFVDGRAVGVTPITVAVAVGAHTVRLEHAGYRSVTTRVDVKYGERARVAARLEGGQDER